MDLLLKYYNSSAHYYVAFMPTEDPDDHPNSITPERKPSCRRAGEKYTPYENWQAEGEMKSFVNLNILFWRVIIYLSEFRQVFFFSLYVGHILLRA